MSSESSSRRLPDPLRELIPLGEMTIKAFGLLTETKVASLFEPIMSHIDIHMAQGNLECAGALIEIAEQVAGTHSERRYRAHRKKLRYLESSGHPKKALELLQALLKEHGNSRKTPFRTAEIIWDHGTLLQRMGEKLEALKYFRNATKRYKRLEHSYNLAGSLFNSATLLYELGRHGEALKACYSALTAGAKAHQDLKANVALQMANCFETMGDDLQCKEFYSEAAQAYRKLGNRRKDSDICYRLGWMCMKEGKLKESEMLFFQALKLKRELDYGSSSARYHLNRAEGYRSVGINAKAISHYRSCLSLATELGLDAFAKQARFGIFRCSQQGFEKLPAHMKLAKATPNDDFKELAKRGHYRSYRSDGAGTELYSESNPKGPSKKERTTLARLFNDMARVQHALGKPNSQAYQKQSEAVLSYHRDES
jgi:tetratricopeptide (TPR) repeat protein